MVKLEQITREEHDKIYDDLLKQTCDDLQMLIKYYQLLSSERKNYNIKYLYDSEKDMISYKKMGTKHIGFKTNES